MWRIPKNTKYRLPSLFGIALAVTMAGLTLAQTPPTKRGTAATPTPDAQVSKTDGSAPITASIDREAEELAHWDAIKHSQKPGDFDSFLQKFPNGTFAAIAKKNSGYWIVDQAGCKAYFGAKPPPINART